MQLRVVKHSLSLQLEHGVAVVDTGQSVSLVCFTVQKSWVMSESYCVGSMKSVITMRWNWIDRQPSKTLE